MKPNGMDYRDLLVRYMRHVLDMEGCTFTGFYLANCGFTPDEVAELQKIADEVYEE